MLFRSGDVKTFAGVTPKRKQDAPTPHITTSDDCSVCHFSTTSFAGATSSLPTGHFPTTQTCTLCHASGTGPGSGVMNHTGITSGCTTCHNGQVFLGVTPVSKPSNHLPTTLACETCHSATQFTNFSGTAMNHTGIVSGCINCHNGQVFAGVRPVSKPINHLPTSLSCETCHSISQFTNFTGGVMNHTGITSGCITCHNGQVFLGVTPVSKPSNHVPTTLTTCESCHPATQFTNFSGATMNHTGVGTTCENCHAAESWKKLRFDHETQSAFKLTGAHKNVACRLCHRPETTDGATFTRFKPVPTACAACHTKEERR